MLAAVDGALHSGHGAAPSLVGPSLGGAIGAAPAVGRAAGGRIGPAGAQRPSMPLGPRRSSAGEVGPRGRAGGCATLDFFSSRCERFGLAAAEPAGAGHLDPLGRPPVGLHLRHRLIPPRCRRRLAGRQPSSSAAPAVALVPAAARPGPFGRRSVGASGVVVARRPSRPRGLLGPLVRRQHHHHVPTVQPGLGLHLGRAARSARRSGRGSACPARGGRPRGPGT